MLKKDSKLNRSLASTWAQHSELEEALKQLRNFINEQQALQDRQRERGDNQQLVIDLNRLTKVGEDIENAGNEMRKNITQAIQEVETTKKKMLNYLQNIDIIHRQSLQNKTTLFEVPSFQATRSERNSQHAEFEEKRSFKSQKIPDFRNRQKKSTTNMSQKSLKPEQHSVSRGSNDRHSHKAEPSEYKSFVEAT